MKTYEHEGKTYPSVTSILQATEDKAETEKLRKWQHKMDKLHGANGATTISDAAKARGTKLHSIIKSYWENPKNFSDPDNNWWKQVKPYIKSVHPEFILSFEQPLYYHGVKPYAGTPDLIKYDQSKKHITMVDFKTSDRIKKRTWIESAFLQCAAYALAYNPQNTEYINLEVVCISPNKLQIFTEDDIKLYSKKWLERLSKFYSMTKT